MSIFDIDRTSNKRSNPTPNTHDKIISPMAHQTASTQYNPSGDTDTARIQQIGKTIVVNDGTANKASFGYNPALDLWGFFAADDGVDVMTNTDLDKLVFNSSQNTFKVVDVLTSSFITGSLTSNNTQVQTNLVTQIPHGLGHIPAFLAYVQLSGASYCLMPYTAKNIFGSTINNHNLKTYSVTADATNIYVILQVTQTTTTNTTISYGGEPVKIYLLQETAN